jgi:hypothetical protein
MRLSQDHPLLASISSTLKIPLPPHPGDEMHSLDYWVVLHLSIQKLWNCYSEQIYIEIANDSQQMKKEITRESSITIHRQLPWSSWFPPTAGREDTGEEKGMEPGKQENQWLRAPLLYTHPLAWRWTYFKNWHANTLICFSPLIYLSAVPPPIWEKRLCS